MLGKTRVLLAVVIVSNAVGNIVLARGARSGRAFDSYSPLDLLNYGIYMLGNPWVLLGVGLLAVFFAAHTILLSWVDLSYVLLVTSIGYILVAFLSVALLGETITPARWAGTILIALGVGIVGSTPESTVREHQ